MSIPKPVIRIMGEGEVADAELVKCLNQFIGDRNAEIYDLIKDEEYSAASNEYGKVMRIVEETVGHDIMDELTQLYDCMVSLERDQVYLRGLHDGYLLGKLLEKGAILTFRRDKQE